MVELVVLLMPLCSRLCLVMQDYYSIEAKYFARDSRVQWSDFRRDSDDRCRLFRMWEEHRCIAYVERLRNTFWEQTILRKMLCPPKPFDLSSAPVPESSDPLPGFHLKKTPTFKNKAKTQAHCHTHVAGGGKTQGKSQS